MQPDSMDCGPACLKMIANYFGRNYTIETLRQSTGVGKNGVSFKDIKIAAETIGMEARGVKISYEALSQKQHLPCIIHWNQEHFVVVYKISRSKVYVADPSCGLVKYSKQEFQNQWCGNVNGVPIGFALLLQPTEKFFLNESEPQMRKGFSFLFGYFRKYKKAFVQLTLGLLVGSVIQLIFPFLTQSIVDIGIHNDNIGFISIILLAQLVLLLSSTLIDFVRRKILLHISSRINISLISDFFIKLMKLPMSFFDAKETGDLLQRIEDHNRVEQFLSVQMLNLIFSILTFIVFGIVIFIYNKLIFMIFIVGSMFYCLWVLLFLRKRRTIDYQLFERRAKNRNIVYQLLTGMQEIKLHGCEQTQRWRWEDAQADLFEINMNSLALQQNQEAGSICINEFKNIVITFVAATLVIKGSISLGMMLAMQYIVGQLNSPLEQLVNFIYQIQDVHMSLERMTEIHEKSDEETNREVKHISEPTIIVNDVSFKYNINDAHDAIQHININIPKGKVTAIVGSSGSGKTTLLKLLLGYYRPTSGIITIGDIDLNTVNMSWWRSKCGAVMQDGFIFSDTIARNIVPEGHIDKDRLYNSAKIASIEDFIDSLPLGYDTMIGSNGRNLSQGQRQRILIARAIYKDPTFLFLDEATNSLDASNERQIVEGLSSFYAGKTVVVVAHRLSTVKNADNIVVLKNGRVVEQGAHQFLVKERGEYYNLIKNQLELGG